MTADKGASSSTTLPAEIYEQKDEAYFGYYSMLSHQAQMLQDTVRTAAYQRAILNNAQHDFVDKVVMDVGAGNGILSFFAAQAGAKKVYAIEASNMVECLQKVVDASHATRKPEVVKGEKEALELMGAGDAGLGGVSFGTTNPTEQRNGWLQGRLVPVHSKVEDVTAKHLEGHTQVDTIVSECLGVLLVHERMCESFLDARDRFLAPGGSVFPSAGTICLAPFEDKQLWNDTANKAKWWLNSNFYGVDVSPFAALAFEENFSSPVVGVFPPQCLLSVSSDYVIDFASITQAELREFTVPVEWVFANAAIVHGLGGWFDLHFNSQSPSNNDTDTTMGEATTNANGMSLESALDTLKTASALASASTPTSNSTDAILPTIPTVSTTSATAGNFMTTSPYADPTHWQQVRFLLPEPLAVNRNQKIAGSVHCKVNDQRSYTMTAHLRLLNPDGTASDSPTTTRKAVWRLDRQTYSWS
ncbi:Protein arginine N-methyltransferase [Kalmanozyma brasiliensis GHG001]|uniref:type I protein arginine methyltransferase n=1 Tax=Kalmanozyma brasiliensis (strain GHG001) TaxID=1365824 RepID=V5GWB5_KALBG|nr:Protein arginine N-methyltransferase [Kalmanozyma brasiliensis GHG001]EST10187.1 Protein arginine N-methyltransferase [Kalmanozyma brasiliensis GHG001]